MAIGESKIILTSGPGAGLSGFIELMAKVFNDPDFEENITNGKYLVLDSKPDEIMCIPTPTEKPIKIVFENGKKIDVIKGDDEDDEPFAND